MARVLGLLLVALAAIVALGGVAGGDQILLRNGEKIEGKILGYDEEQALVQLASGEVRRVPRASIKEVARADDDRDERRPAAGSRERCRACEGKGKTQCGSCELCPRCSASGASDCPRCRGAKTVTCSQCGGRGTVDVRRWVRTGSHVEHHRLIQDGYWDTVAVRCPTCLGPGTQWCGKCRGRGDINCSVCKGSGLSPRCGTCGGSRLVRCELCEGSGRMVEGKPKGLLLADILTELADDTLTSAQRTTLVKKVKGAYVEASFTVGDVVVERGGCKIVATLCGTPLWCRFGDKLKDRVLAVRRGAMLTVRGVLVDVEGGPVVVEGDDLTTEAAQRPVDPPDPAPEAPAAAAPSHRLLGDVLQEIFGDRTLTDVQREERVRRALGSRVEAAFQVENVERGHRGDVLIARYAGAGLRCEFPLPFHERILAIHRGDTVTVRGAIGTLNEREVVLRGDDLEIEARSRPTPQGEPAPGEPGAEDDE